MAKLHTTNKYMRIAADLRHRIMAGELTPGEALRLVPVAREYECGLGTATEALRLLVGEGLLRHAGRQHGYRVRDRVLWASTPPKIAATEITCPHCGRDVEVGVVVLAASG
ncbi:MAG: GntR family transcriptional regulator [Streptosporangiaceae bacterium]|nr:GntR family transcriptional regulator [Streptosporangiaceae bacterium]